MLKLLGKIPVSNSFLSEVLRQVSYETKIKKYFPEDHVSNFYLNCLTNSSLVFCKNADWHFDNSESDFNFNFSILWVLKTKNSVLEVKDKKNKIKSLKLKKGDLIEFKNSSYHRLNHLEGKISCFLVIDFHKEVKDVDKVKVKLKEFSQLIRKGEITLR